MNLIRPYTKILTPIDRSTVLPMLERAGRTCYKSEDKITDESASKFVGMICQRNHESVLEHVSVSVLFVCDRGVSHELVRHRIASFSQESTRYVNYGKKGMTVVIPPWLPELQEGEYKPELTGAVPAGASIAASQWLNAMHHAEVMYNLLLNQQWKPEHARSVLPNSLKTEVVMTANLREWRHIFKLRTASAAHPQMRELMVPLFHNFRDNLPEIFVNPT